MLVEEIGMITLQSFIRVTLLGIIKNYMVKVVQEILFFYPTGENQLISVTFYLYFNVNIIIVLTYRVMYG